MLVLAATAAPAQADDWTGAIGDWFVGGNWFDGSAPTAGDAANINNGGTAQIGAPGAVSSTGTLGNLGGESGTVEVGATGTWVMGAGSGLTVGRLGTGTLDISGGGTVQNITGTIGFTGAGTGTVTVDGAGSTWTNSNTLTIGEFGDGTLDISDGGAVTAASFISIGHGTAGTGAVTVDGAGTSLAGSSVFAVGNAGIGTLDITGGGAASASGAATIGLGDDGDGALTVDGVGSTWTGSSSLTLGSFGTGALDISDGGAVSNTAGLLGQFGGSTGTATVDGAGSTWANSGSLVVGDAGDGTLDIIDGGAVTVAGSITLGEDGTGAVTVDGTGSTLDGNSALIVGVDGDGTLDISGGGAVSNTFGVVGENALGTGAVTVDGAGSDWTNNGSLIVGLEGDGTLDITGGGAVTATGSISVGDDALSSGGVTVTGTGASLAGDSIFTVGDAGTGTLAISNGGAVSNDSFGVIGFISTGDGAVTVDGAGSSWTGGDFLYVGDAGQATLDISGGGAVSNTTGVIGDDATGAGAVTVDGAGSSWASNGFLIVGNAGDGTLTISGGGAVSNTSVAFIGDAATGTGIVTVAGAGSTWTADAFLHVGHDGEGTLTVSDDGAVEAGNVTIATGAGSTGTLNIGAAAGDAAVAAGALDTGSITFGDGTGSIVFNHTSDDFELDADIAGTGSIVHQAGFTTLTGNNSAFAGTTSLEAGTLIVDGQLGGSMSVVDAILGGSGTIGATVLGSGAVLAPGNSIGTLNVAGALDFASGSTYEVETNDGGNTAGVNNDWVHATGAATIDIGAFVSVMPENGTDNGLSYAPSTLYTIVTADGGVTGTFGGVTDSFAFLDPSLTYDANNVYLTLDLTADLQSAAETLNQFNTAGAADALGFGNPLYNEIVLMTAADAQAAFDALSGELHASGRSMSFHSMRHVREALLARLRAQAGGSGAQMAVAPAAGDETPGAAYVWGHVFGAWGSADGNGNYASLDRRTAGFLGGLDKPLGEASRIGVSAGYSRTDFDVDTRASSGESDDFHLAAYAGTRLGAIDLDGVLNYAYRKVETERTAIVGALTNELTADYDVHVAQAAVEAGFDIDTGPVLLTPFAGLAVIHVETGGFTEQGGPAALTLSSSSDTTGVSTLGLRARREAGQVALSGSAGWRHAFGDVDPVSNAAFASAPATRFALHGTPIAEDALALEAAIEAKLDPRTTLSLGYIGELAADARDHDLRVGLRITF
jgi:T5SS/PEP-CTERM-associated repeat protein